MWKGLKKLIFNTDIDDISEEGTLSDIELPKKEKEKPDVYMEAPLKEAVQASPDTDNLILLSRIYGISMDELLRTEDEIPMPENAEMPEIEEAVPAPAGDGGPFSGDAAETAADGWGNTPEYVHIGLDGIHCKDKDSEVHPNE